jgi:DHA2 family multidrug resistance protein-like MFS transporter
VGKDFDLGFNVVTGGFADHVGRVKIVKIGFYLSIFGSLLVGFAPAGSMASRSCWPSEPGRGFQAHA